MSSNFPAPSYSTLTNRVISGLDVDIHEATVSSLRGSLISIICDETQDITGRSVVAVVAATLTGKWLIALEEVVSTNAVTIIDVVERAMASVGVHHNQVVAFTVDGARYMSKASNELPGEHIHCISHILHLMAKDLMKSVQPLNTLVTIISRLLSVGSSKKRLNRIKAIA